MQNYHQQYGLKAEALGCDRGGAPVFRGAAFEVGPGEAVQIFGPNGAGKSSLLAVLAGHVEPVEGVLRWRRGDAQDWRTAQPHQAMQFLGHERGAKLSLTVGENLRFWAARYGRRLSAEAQRDILTRIGLDAYADAKAYHLSAGQRRRLDMARLIIAERSVWLLDEPAAFVDADGAALIAALVGEHQTRGGLAVIATHDALAINAAAMTISAS